ncbi:LysR family transcriptional regulator [Bradyrhizobium aeschynomenes]|uniref:LysR family transcriptional regulator n=1 Tax=Bradyrhizobium aeschynomenes TaxID=2734909 RepID=UPI00155449DA|nr:LysR family transcriptional regulator [Bradyrhizobium aeschynomenes]NPV20919.1 LysR family transcriptional regulator [Bradyrhizobium aeschynomenes]
MDKSDISIVNMRSFVRVAERGSLSAVARELGIGQSTVSRHLQELEHTIGVPLLSRTTRRVTLTDEGSRYYANCVQILRLIDQAGDEARGARGAAAGTIRISCTAAFGILHITRLVFAFQDRYPDIAIDLNLTDERIDLVREGVDIALRLAPLIDSSLKLRPLGYSHRLLVASPGYLEKRGTPRTPQDLIGHDGIRMTNVAGSEILVLMGPDGERHEVPFRSRFRTNHGLGVREAVVAGRGIGGSHAWLVDDLIAAGRLAVILPDHRLSSTPLNMLIVPERAGIARVRLLIDYLAEEIVRLPGIRPEP